MITELRAGDVVLTKNDPRCVREVVAGRRCQDFFWYEAADLDVTKGHAIAATCQDVIRGCTPDEADGDELGMRQGVKVICASRDPRATRIVSVAKVQDTVFHVAVADLRESCVLLCANGVWVVSLRI